MEAGGWNKIFSRQVGHQTEDTKKWMNKPRDQCKELYWTARRKG